MSDVDRRASIRGAAEAVATTSLVGVSASPGDAKPISGRVDAGPRPGEAGAVRPYAIDNASGALTSTWEIGRSPATGLEGNVAV